MQQYPLLQTKLYIPPIRPDPSTGSFQDTLRARLVSRPRLIERLNAGLDCKLTLISAPAGFGKTTLVSEWVHRRAAVTVPVRVAWLSLDESDNDPTRFLTYFVAALQTVEASLGKGALNALQSPGVADATTPPPAEAVLTSLINEITAIPDRIVLVLDDYHLIEAQPIHEALTFLLEHLPAPPGGIHLVIATREDPLLPLARLRARGQLTELRATDLRFSSAEAAEFLNRVMGLDLSAEDIAALETRTEGWIAGLHLAAISMQGLKDATGFIESFTGSHRFVLDYLIQEVLEQQSASVQTFLLQTAVLDRLTGSLCDAVRFGIAKAPSTARADAVRFGIAKAPSTARADAVRFGTAESADRSASGQDNGRATLEKLERANLFIVPLDEERRWYRYHHLFSDLLHQRLRQTQPDWVPTLHLRASQWYERNGFADEAIEHALRAEDFARAANLIEELAEATWQRGEHAKLRLWLDGLPVEVIHSKPHLCLFHTWYLFTSGHQDAAELSLQAAEQALDPSTDLATDTSPLDREDRMSDSDTMKLRGRAAVIRTFMATYMGDVAAIIQHARQALEYLPEQDLTWRSTAALALGDAQGFKGDMAAAYQARLEAAEASRSAGNTVFSILAYLKVAITLREQGLLQRTIEICQQQIQLADTSGLSRGSVAGCLLAIWGEVLAELGDLEGAIVLTNKGVELTEPGGDLAMLGWSYMCLTRALFSGGDMTGAEEIVQKMENTARESNVPPWITNQMAAWQTRLWLAQDRLEAASQWVRERGLVAAGEPKSLHEFDFFSLNDHLLLARILIAQERLDEASRLLPRLLEAAEAGGRTSKSIEILLLQALAFQARGNTTQAMTALEQALALAEPGSFVSIFVDEGPPMARLLYEALSRGIASDYVQRLLAAFPVADPEEPAPSSTQAPESEIVEPLSKRELEVLQLIAEGLTNQEVASRLFLSLNTVKAHSRNIYGKLGVRSRTQAVARARALGVLPFA